MITWFVRWLLTRKEKAKTRAEAKEKARIEATEEQLRNRRFHHAILEHMTTGIHIFVDADRGNVECRAPLTTCQLASSQEIVDNATWWKVDTTRYNNNCKRMTQQEIIAIKEEIKKAY